MDALVRTVLNTIIRAAVYRGMRSTSGVLLVLVVIAAAVAMVVTQR